MRFSWAAWAALAAAVPAAAQSTTTCNPTTKACPANMALGTTADFNWVTDGFDSNLWKRTGSVDFTPYGAQFNVVNKLDSPSLESLFYIFFGRVECIFRAAPGQGIVSFFSLLSDDLDQVDARILGAKTGSWRSNYYGKGLNGTDESKVFNLKDITTNAYNYTFLWTKEKIEWHVDGQLKRTLNYADANSGATFPQTPMRVRLGVLPMGDPDNSEDMIAEAGGIISYGKGPYIMSAKSMRVQDFSTGKEYVYSDRSGSMASITTTAGKSAAYNRVHRPRGLLAKWNALSSTVKIAIVVAVASVVAIAILALTWVCIRQRRRGKRERKHEDAAFQSGVDEFGSQHKEYGHQAGRMY